MICGCVLNIIKLIVFEKKILVIKNKYVLYIIDENSVDIYEKKIILF